MKQQLLYYSAWLLGLPLLPLLYLQGRRVRAVVPQLPEADDVEGTVTNGPGTLHVLALGESTVAGVGVRHCSGFAGWLSRHLARRSGSSVRWTAVARSGYAAHQVTAELVPRIPRRRYDLVVIGLGGNDTFRLHSPLRWKRDMGDLIHAVRDRLPRCPIVIANLPPVGDFPAFPRLMQLVLGGMVRLHGAVIEDLPDRFPEVRYASRPVRLEEWVEHHPGAIGLADLFCDGVHPSPLAYEIWMKEIVDLAWDRREPVDDTV